MKGEVENSWSRTQAGGVGASYIGRQALESGATASLYDSNYGVPVAHHHEGESEEEEEHGISIDLEQKRLDFRARTPLTASDGPGPRISRRRERLPRTRRSSRMAYRHAVRGRRQ